MRLQNFKLYQYELDLKIAPYKRTGFIISLIDEKKNRGFGEIAPLHPWSFETLNQCFKEIEKIKELIFKIPLHLFIETISKHSLSPSVLFGIETALMSLFKKKKFFLFPLVLFCQGQRMKF